MKYIVKSVIHGLTKEIINPSKEPQIIVIKADKQKDLEELIKLGLIEIYVKDNKVLEEIKIEEKIENKETDKKIEKKELEENRDVEFDDEIAVIEVSEEKKPKNKPFAPPRRK